jgi:serine/threonine protein kinase
MFLYAGSVDDYVAANPARRREPAFLERVFQGTLRALMFIAHHGIVHRDVKPANILHYMTQKWRR